MRYITPFFLTSTFQTTCPERGWKLCNLHLFQLQTYSLSKPLAPKGDGNFDANFFFRAIGIFPNHLPRKGMETLAIAHQV